MGLFDQMEGMEDILNDFVVETTELIEQLDEDLLTLESGEVEEEMVNRIFRGFHTIKGTSGFLNFEACNQLAHSAENILNMIRTKELEPTSKMMDVLLETVDWFKGFVGDIAERVEKNYDISELIEAIEFISRKSDSAEQVDENLKSAEMKRPAVEVPRELIKEFISESNEILETLDNDLLVLELEADDEEYVNSLFRAFHTLKGNSSMMGLESMSDVAHKSEDLLGLLREKKITPSADIVDVLLSSVDFMRGIVGEVGGDEVNEHDPSELVNKLLKFVGKDHGNGNGNGSGNGGGNGKMAVAAEEKGVNPRKKSSVSGPAGVKKIESTIRVDVERLEKLMNQAGELVLEKNRLIQISQVMKQKFSGEKEISDLDSLNNSLGNVTTLIQESVMQMRMLPISKVFRKFPRMVRDLGKENNKEVELIVRGEDTELDRSVIESIGDPLVHLLRNAVDHGLEETEARLKSGKPRKGVIRLSACQKGNYIIIELSDDGSGIDPEIIARKAVEKGIITEETLRTMSRKDIINLIFKPGFSTAKVITDVSGRGVGMDVVHSNIAKLNGSVEIKSEVGCGTTFIIKIPLTLTIQTGMVVRVWNEIYIVPLQNILETVKLQENLIEKIRGCEIMKYRDFVLPIIRMDELYNIPHDEDGSDQFIIVVANEESRVGLVVSELIGQEETVVKPMGEVLGKVPGIAGATIRGDGRISLIVDTSELVEGVRLKEVA
ncbi:MAG: chemotaxis protein CheA [FCB group bacterium]|nr:chemotaxis protein CheA [FCB group bacterium]